MHDVDPAVVALVPFQLGLDLGRVAHQEKFFDVRIVAQRHDCTGNKIERTEIAAHRIQGDLHRKQILRALAALCKIKFESRARRASYALPSTVRT